MVEHQHMEHLGDSNANTKLMLSCISLVLACVQSATLWNLFVVTVSPLLCCWAKNIKNYIQPGCVI